MEKVVIMSDSRFLLTTLFHDQDGTVDFPFDDVPRHPVVVFQ
jgi:hypothetical protein